MRVISGAAKGVKLYCPDGFEVRPTADRIKESIFNIIQMDLPGAIVLDLFAGSGALGIESLSRGAEKVVFVDQSRKSIQFIKKNLIATKLFDKATIMCMPVKKALEKMDTPFDLIFMDPPYLKGYIIPTLQDIGFRNLLKEEGIIVVEHDKRDILPDTIDIFAIYKQKQYGRTTVSFYKRFKER